MNGSVIAAATPRKAHEDKILLDGIDFRHTMRSPLAHYDVMLGSLVAIGIIVGLVPAGRKGRGAAIGSIVVHPAHRDPARPADRPPAAGQVIMAIAGCAGLALLGYLWVRAQLTTRA
ncbi:hypothetical protein ACFQ0B_54480 [Nonomuraea thailandensis]